MNSSFKIKALSYESLNVQRSRSCVNSELYGMGALEVGVGGWGIWGTAYLCSGSHVVFLVKGHRERHKHQVRAGMASSRPGLVLIWVHFLFPVINEQQLLSVILLMNQGTLPVWWSPTPCSFVVSDLIYLLFIWSITVVWIYATCCWILNNISCNLMAWKYTKNMYFLSFIYGSYLPNKIKKFILVQTKLKAVQFTQKSITCLR